MRDHCRAAVTWAAFPPLVYIHQGTVAQGDDFFPKRWADVPAVADPERRIYDAFDVHRGRLGQLLGPRVLARGVAAAVRGNGVGKPVGDTRVMPGLFLVDDRNILWSHPFRHAGDKPDLKALAQRVKALTA